MPLEDWPEERANQLFEVMKKGKRKFGFWLGPRSQIKYANQLDFPSTETTNAEFQICRGYLNEEGFSDSEIRDLEIDNIVECGTFGRESGKMMRTRLIAGAIGALTVYNIFMIALYCT
ncbi:hypothetical protein F5884DRAFT_838398 [Xylogone sp. PMI_703]|nr:hypothetical protein F5884DRAFT_838398 [Xylogone sp. PMI_703]